MTYRITGYHEGGKGVRKKLLAFGLTPNTTFEVIRTAPLGDPIEIKVRGYMLSLRKTEFDSLQLEELDEEKSKVCFSCSKKGCHGS